MGMKKKRKDHQIRSPEKQNFVCLIRETKGTTMVEVLVAVLIVMIVMTMFNKVVASSADIYQKSLKAIRETEDFNAEYQTKDAQAGKESLEGTIILKEESGRIEIMLPHGQVKKYTDSDGTGISRYSIDEKSGGGAGEP